VQIQRSRANPENLVEDGPPLDRVSDYAEIDVDCTLRGRRTVVVLPELPETVPVNFVLFTNAVRIRLHLSNALRVVVNEGLLDEDLKLDTTRIKNETARSGMEAFLKEAVRPGVVLRFVFTKPSEP
jgi:hypothetical protein